MFCIYPERNDVRNVITHIVMHSSAISSAIRCAQNRNDCGRSARPFKIGTLPLLAGGKHGLRLRDRSRAPIDKGHEAAPALAFQRRVVPPNPLGRDPFGVAPVELEAVISRHPAPQLVSFIRLHTTIFTL